MRQGFGEVFFFDLLDKADACHKLTSIDLFKFFLTIYEGFLHTLRSKLFLDGKDYIPRPFYKEKDAEKCVKVKNHLTNT